ncbi:MAG: VWA domain-containing protein [Haloferacaceae archaeon]
MIDFGGRKKPSGIRDSRLSFGDIVGQAELKRALLAVAADDGLDGLLIRGEKGTAKSTAVRALTDLLPVQSVVADCPYGCPPDDPDRQCADCRERAAPPTAERSVPLVTLPLGATRERVVGSLSVADALDGDPTFEPGLLARANRGVLYVDEVNLLDDHLVDALLDAAASGINRVERDGVSVVHPADFTLVGTMNPEEGDLRPQLRDRFALQATVTGCEDLDRRVAIVDRAVDRTDLDGPDGSGGAGENRWNDPGRRLRAARERIDRVRLPEEFAREAAECCRDAGVEGHRADIATARAATAFAALDGRGTVIRSDVRRAAELAIPHRVRSRPFEDATDPSDLIEERLGESDGEGDEGDGPDDTTDGDAADGDGRGGIDEADGGGNAGGGGPDDGGGNAGDGGPDDGGGNAGDGGPDDGPGDTTDGDATGEEQAPSVDGDPGDPTGVDGDDGVTAGAGGADGSNRDGRGRTAARPAGGERDQEGDDPAAGTEDDDATPLVPGGERAGVGTARAPDLPTPDPGAGTGDGPGAGPGTAGDGPRVRTEPAESGDAVDAAASVRAAAERGASAVGRRDLRRSVRAGDDAALVLFVVDASASMRPAMRAAKGTVLELLKDAYRERDEVGFVAFAGDDAEVLLPPTDSVTLAARHLKDLPTGDRTPLPAGLGTAAAVLERADPASAVVVLVTDGRANVADGSPVAATRAAARRLSTLGAHTLVVDAGDGRPGVVPAVVEETGGDRVPLDALTAERVDDAVEAAKETEI